MKYIEIIKIGVIKPSVSLYIFSRLIFFSIIKKINIPTHANARLFLVLKAREKRTPKAK